MLFDNLFSMMNPAVTLGLLAGIVGLFATVTGVYVMYEAKDRKCEISRDLRLH